jgi:hypothetical protein
LGVSTPLTSTGIIASLFLTAIITLNIRGMQYIYVYISTCLLNLHGRTVAARSGNLFDLIHFIFADIGVTFLDSGIIKPCIYHPPLGIENI